MVQHEYKSILCILVESILTNTTFRITKMSLLIKNIYSIQENYYKLYRNIFVNKKMFIKITITEINFFKLRNIFLNILVYYLTVRKL